MNNYQMEIEPMSGVIPPDIISENSSTNFTSILAEFALVDQKVNNTRMGYNQEANTYKIIYNVDRKTQADYIAIQVGSLGKFMNEEWYQTWVYIHNSTFVNFYKLGEIKDGRYEGYYICIVVYPNGNLYTPSHERYHNLDPNHERFKLPYAYYAISKNGKEINALTHEDELALDTRITRTSSESRVSNNYDKSDDPREQTPSLVSRLTSCFGCRKPKPKEKTFGGRRTRRAQKKRRTAKKHHKKHNVSRRHKTHRK